MNLLKERILKDGNITHKNILKVDSFLNHQIDTALLNEIGKEFKRLFSDKAVTKILTIEASGIAIASVAAQYFNNNLVFAKKAKSKNLDDNLYTTVVHSYTYDMDYTITVAKKFLSPSDNVLIIDDFMAQGHAMNGLLEVVSKSGATVAGIGIVIEKGFQGGGDNLRAKGYNLKSLAIIDEMNNGKIIFRE